MQKRRKFGSESVTRLIVSVPVSVVGEIERVSGSKYPRPNRYNRHPAFGNRSEFVRLAIVEKLERDQVIIDNFRGATDT
jgi:metal-responsive CopG/Arc/MetJ family transcriptional regulator